MASIVKIKRSSVLGKRPTTSEITGGELALNTRDGKLFSSDGSSVFEVGANVHSLSVGTGGISFANGSMMMPSSDGSADQVLKTDGSGSLSWTDQSASSAVDLLSPFPFYRSNGDLDSITVINAEFPFYRANGTKDVIIITG